MARAESFTAAAAELGMTASAVSRQVKSLEDRLGVRLLNRTTRRVSLTDEGRAFRDRIEGVLDAAAEAELEAKSTASELAGRLRIGAPMDFGRLHLAGAIADFGAAHPALSLEVELADRFVDILDEGLDVVVRIGAPLDSALVSRTIAPCHRVVCAAPGYLDEHGRPEDAAALAGHRRIAYAYEADQSWALETDEGPVRVRVPVAHRSNNGEMTRAMLVAGLGVALMPTFLVADDLRAGRLETVLARRLSSTIPIQALYPHRKHLSARVRAFVDHLVAHCGTRPYWDEGLGLGP